MSTVVDSETGRVRSLLVDEDGNLKVVAEGVTLEAGDITLDLTATDAKLDTLIAQRTGVPGVARQLAAGSSSADTALTAGIKRISMRATGADIRYKIGSSSQTASATTHFIASGERLELALPATPHIAVIRNASTDGVLEVTELA